MFLLAYKWRRALLATNWRIAHLLTLLYDSRITSKTFWQGKVNGRWFTKNAIWRVFKRAIFRISKLLKLNKNLMQLFLLQMHSDIVNSTPNLIWLMNHYSSMSFVLTLSRCWSLRDYTQENLLNHNFHIIPINRSCLVLLKIIKWYIRTNIYQFNLRHYQFPLSSFLTCIV